MISHFAIIQTISRAYFSRKANSSEMKEASGNESDFCSLLVVHPPPSVPRARFRRGKRERPPGLMSLREWIMDLSAAMPGIPGWIFIMHLSLRYPCTGDPGVWSCVRAHAPSAQSVLADRCSHPCSCLWTRGSRACSLTKPREIHGAHASGSPRVRGTLKFNQLSALLYIFNIRTRHK